MMMATGDIAIPAMQEMQARGQLVALITQPDRPAGRHRRLTSPRIKEKALACGIPVMQPESVRDAQVVEALRELAPDVVVVMAYGQILSQEVIDVPRLACINAHASLLPRHRGAACIQAAIEAGDDETGITIIHVVKKLDAGDIICRAALPLRGTETAEDLHETLAVLAPEPLMRALRALENGEATREAQNEDIATYARKLVRADGCINWTEPALQVARKIRAYHPWPGTYTFYTSVKSGTVKPLKIFPPVDVFTAMAKPPNAVPGTVLHAGAEGLIVSCGTGNGAIRISTLQPPGARKMNVESFFAGHKMTIGAVLGEQEVRGTKYEVRSGKAGERREG